MYAWILQHDDRWSFIALYVTLAVVLSLWISLFWLVALVVVHFAFELARQGAAGAAGAQRVGLALWEVKLDVALVLFALALSLYMNVVLGVLGLQAAARAGSAANASLRTGSRALAWERGIRGVLLTADDAAQVGRVLGRRGGAAAVAMRDERDATGPVRQEHAAGGAAASAIPLPAAVGWRGAWGVGDSVAIGLAVLCTALIVAAPALTGISAAEALQMLRAELHPYPR